MQHIVDSLMQGYNARWSNDNPWITKEIEYEFVVPIKNPRTNRPTRTFRYGGKIDGIIERRDWQDGWNLYLLEHKTTQLDASEGSAYHQRLSIDSQITKYMLAMHLLGMPVTTCLYDVIRKPALRQRKEESTSDFAVRLTNDCIERPDFYYHRHTVTRSDTDLFRAAEELHIDQAEIAKAMKSHDTRKNPGACLDWNSCCPFLALCCGTRDKDSYLTNTKLHPELQTEEPNVITHSRLSTFHQCRRKHYWIYERNLAQSSKAFDFGTAMHKALNSWWAQFYSDSDPRRLGLRQDLQSTQNGLEQVSVDPSAEQELTVQVEERLVDGD